MTNEENYDLFAGLEDELGVEKVEKTVPSVPDVTAKKKVNESKKKSSQDASPAKTEKPKEKLLDPTWTVAYAGTLITVPEENMTVDRLHAFLETDYPELAKSRSSCAFDDTAKIITFAPNGSKKG